MGGVLRQWWPLLAAVTLIQISTGLQSTTIGLTVDSLRFSPTAISTIMSSYYLGSVLASLVLPRVVAAIAHVRAYFLFAALTAMGPLLFLPGAYIPTWAAARFLFGFGLAGCYIVVESWLNARTANESRGRVFAIYILAQLGSLMVAQFFVPFAVGHFALSVLGMTAFVLLSTVPLFIRLPPRPADMPYQKASFVALAQASPIGVVGAIVSGLLWSSITAMAPIYAQRIGYTANGAAAFVAAAIFGGILLQLPLGALSDVRDRRHVLAAMSALAGVAALAGQVFAALDFYAALVCIAAFGGLTFPFYAVAVSHVNDRIDPAHRVAASGAMILLFGAGSVLGPILGSSSMAALGPGGYFWMLAAITFAFAAYALYRIRVARPSAPKQTV